jgi:general secretion pathway protein J
MLQHKQKDVQQNIAQSSQKGFTLLEVLVSIAIFAVIGLGANQMLRTMIDTHDRTKLKIETMNEMTRVFAALERDFGQAVPRYIRDEFGDPIPSLLVAQGAYAVELTRTGWSNPINLPRSNLQRVAYGVNQDEQLVRSFWLVLDRAEESEPVEQILLPGVQDFRISLLTQDGQTTNVWPDGNFEEAFPSTVEIFLETEALGELRKVYNLVDLINQRAASGEGGQDDGSQSDGNGGNGQDQQGQNNDPDAVNSVEGQL